MNPGWSAWRVRVTAVAAAAVLFLAGALVIAAPAPSFQELEEALTCQCGCGLTVHSCNHVDCPSAIPLRAEIRERMGLGHDKQQILAYFMQKYGEKILSAPTAQGFNLLAWVTPFALLAVAGGLVALVVARWSRHGDGPSPPVAPPTGVAPYRDVLERELERFDR